MIRRLLSNSRLMNRLLLREISSIRISFSSGRVIRGDFQMAVSEGRRINEYANSMFRFEHLHDK